jgi:hypothetical protein
MKYALILAWVAATVYLFVVLGEGSEEAKLVLSDHAQAHANIVDLKKETVTDKKGRETDFYRLYYAFDVDGSSYKGDMPISEEIFNKAQGEKKIQGIVYYTKDPKINGLKQVFEQAANPVFIYGLSCVLSIILGAVLFFVHRKWFKKQPA